jgi:hypothetical protein
VDGLIASLWSCEACLEKGKFLCGFSSIATLVISHVSLLSLFTGSNLKKIALHYNVSLYNTSSARSWAYCAARIRAKVGQDNE